MMENDRDTHFAGFAKLLTQELVDHYMIVMHPRALECARPYIEELIAQRAYDLVQSAVHHIKSEVHEMNFATWESATDIPDLTEWPKQTENPPHC